MTEVVPLPRCPACDGSTILIRDRFLGISSIIRCRDCGTESLHPQTDDARLKEIYSQDYFDHWGIDWDQSLIPMKRRKFTWLLDNYGFQPGARLLDLGCATGFFLELMESRGFQPYGIDINDFAIQNCRELIPSAAVHAGVIADRPFEEATFDGVFMIDMIEHVRDPQKELRMVAERLSLGGVVVISTPRLDSLHRTWMRWTWWHYKQEHLTYFTFKGLTTLLGSVGLRVVKSRSTVKFVTLGYLFRNLQAYPHFLLTPLSSFLFKLLPFLRTLIFPLRLGEMTVVARRESYPSA